MALERGRARVATFLTPGASLPSPRHASESRSGADSVESYRPATSRDSSASSRPRRLSATFLRSSRSNGALRTSPEPSKHTRVGSLTSTTPLATTPLATAHNINGTTTVSTPTAHLTKHMPLSAQPASPAVGKGLQSMIQADRLHDDLPLPPPIGADMDHRRGISPSSRGSSLVRGRPSSSDAPSRGDSRTSSPARDLLQPMTPTEGRLTKKQSWISGGDRGSKSHSRNSSTASASDVPAMTPVFILGPRENTPYDHSDLIHSLPVREIWQPHGNLIVYLFQDSTSPSFRVPAAVVASSAVWSSRLQPGGGPGLSAANNHMRSMTNGLDSLSIEDNHTPKPELFHLQLPMGISAKRPGDMGHETIDRLVAVRDLFAFLIGQILVGTARMPTLFSIFNVIADGLQQFEFSNADGTSLGEEATSSFLGYVEDLRLDDVRNNQHKMLEALVLGERMKCFRPLYSEAYVHGVGKWDELVHAKSSLFKRISSATRQRMEKSSMDLHNTRAGIEAHLNEFDFPSLFAGFAASSATAKIIDAKAWKTAWVAMRRHTLSLYKQRYGDWPPKAKSKKNDFEESGLNRLLLQELYHDFCDLYDMLVDRRSLTSRTIDVTANDEIPSPDAETEQLRKLLSEFDRSMPPVRPPIPYDLPQMPSLSALRRDPDAMSSKSRTKERSKKLSDDDVNLALMQSYNRDAIKATPFLESFMTFERACAHGKTLQEMADLRTGQWIFIYVILQSLPLVVVDAPSLRWTEGVEYFLCAPPRGPAPWLKEDLAPQMAYYSVAGGAGVVSMPVDVLDFSVEGIYHRSHCWQVAAAWSSGASGGDRPRPTLTVPTHPVPSPDMFESPVPLTAGGMSSTRAHRSSINLGLQALPLPPGVRPLDPSSPMRKVSTPDPTKSFDAILAQTAQPASQPRRKKT